MSSVLSNTPNQSTRLFFKTTLSKTSFHKNGFQRCQRSLKLVTLQNGNRGNSYLGVYFKKQQQQRK